MIAAKKQVLQMIPQDKQASFSVEFDAILKKDDMDMKLDFVFIKLFTLSEWHIGSSSFFAHDGSDYPFARLYSSPT